VAVPRCVRADGPDHLHFLYRYTGKAKPPPRTITYFESWPASRTLEESQEWIAERQKKKDEARLREKEAYKAFGRAVGMDVERIEREAAAERAAKEPAGPQSGATK
jgi:hypothetical protein